MFRDFYYEVGDHPQTYIDYECKFAARNLAYRNPTTILDIGSYRHFVLGLLASYKITTLDVRRRKSSLHNETILNSDAKQLNILSNSFDTILSLCTLEHLGLGRYGNECDKNADIKAFNEMVRGLKPGGTLYITNSNIEAF